MFVHVWVHFMSDCLEGIEQDVRKDSQIRFRRFVNPVQITVASLLPPHHTPLWNSSSEAITPRWRILDVITSICRLFYSHCEVTCRLPLTSPHNGQLQSTHQSLSAKNVDTQNLVEITTLDYLETSTNLLMCRIISYSLHCVNAPITSLLYAISKLSSALNATFTSPSLMVWRTHIHTWKSWFIIWYEYCVKSIGSAFHVLAATLLRGNRLSDIWKSWKSHMQETDMWNFSLPSHFIHFFLHLHAFKISSAL